MNPEQSSQHDINAASHALDDDLRTKSHTLRELGAWWRVNVFNYYGTPVTVDSVTVWNRHFCSSCVFELEGSVVKLFGVGNGNLLAESSALTSDLIQTVDFGGPVTGVYWVQVQQESKSAPLQLAKIEAYGKVES